MGWCWNKRLRRLMFYVADNWVSHTPLMHWWNCHMLAGDLRMRGNLIFDWSFPFFYSPLTVNCELITSWPLWASVCWSSDLAHLMWWHYCIWERIIHCCYSSERLGRTWCHYLMSLRNGACRFGCLWNQRGHLQQGPKMTQRTDFIVTEWNSHFLWVKYNSMERGFW